MQNEHFLGGQERYFLFEDKLDIRNFQETLGKTSVVMLLFSGVLKINVLSKVLRVLSPKN